MPESAFCILREISDFMLFVRY